MTRAARARPPRIVRMLAAVVVAAGLAVGCGDDGETELGVALGAALSDTEEGALTVAASAAEAMLHASASSPEETPQATEEADPPTTTEMAPAAPQPSPSPPNPSTGGPGRTDPGPAPDPSRPDRPGNDLPPPPGSPAEEFERFCERYPKACD